jgi:hypothetical protein
VAADDFAPHRDRRTLESARLCSSASFCCTSNHALNSSESAGARDHSGGNGPCGIPLEVVTAAAAVAVEGMLLALCMAALMSACADAEETDAAEEDASPFEVCTIDGPGKK